MSRTIPYDRSRRALYTPCADAISLDASALGSEALLCAEMARLVYCPFHDANDGALIKEAITAQLASIGFAQPKFIYGAALQAFITVNPERQLGVLAYRGTQPDELRDIWTDLQVWPWRWAGSGWVHYGFARNLKQKWGEIESYLAKQSGIRWLYTGHSLGAALATLSAGLRPPDALYTFGSPRVGNATFAASLANVRHERYVDCSDKVCQVPSAGFYRHVGTQKYFDRDGILRPNISDGDIAEDQRIAKENYPRALDENVVFRNFADHAPVNYIYALRAMV